MALVVAAVGGGGNLHPLKGIFNFHERGKERVLGVTAVTAAKKAYHFWSRRQGLSGKRNHQSETAFQVCGKAAMYC